MAEDYELRRDRIDSYDRSYEGFWLSQGGCPSDDGVNKIYVSWEESDRLIRVIVATKKLHEAELELTNL